MIMIGDRNNGRGFGEGGVQDAERGLRRPLVSSLAESAGQQRKMLLSANHPSRRGPMPVLAIFEQPNLDEGTYASMLEQLMPVLRSPKGFISHAGGPSPADGTRIIETWESEADSQNFSTRT